MTNPRVPFSFTDDFKLPPPNGKSIIVHVVVNVESWHFEQPMPRKILTAPHGNETLPDIPNRNAADDEYYPFVSTGTFTNAVGANINHYDAIATVTIASHEEIFP